MSDSSFPGEWLKEWVLFLLTTENTEYTENLEGFLCVLRELRGETIGQAHTNIHSFFSARLMFAKSPVLY